jgi:hypothetical protein
MPEHGTHLIAFRDGSYKKVTPTPDGWKHSQWIHYTLDDGSVVMCNPANINYIHRGIDNSVYADPAKPMDMPGEVEVSTDFVPKFGQKSG